MFVEFFDYFYRRVNTDTVLVSSVFSGDGAVVRMREANCYVATSKNLCGPANNAPNGYPQYAGTTTHYADIDYDSTACLSNGGRDEVSFGQLPGGYVAWARAGGTALPSSAGTSCSTATSRSIRGHRMKTGGLYGSKPGPVPITN